MSYPLVWKGLQDSYPVAEYLVVFCFLTVLPQHRVPKANEFFLAKAHRTPLRPWETWAMTERSALSFQRQSKKLHTAWMATHCNTTRNPVLQICDDLLVFGFRALSLYILCLLLEANIRNWNASWHKPSKYFDSIHDINATQLLKPCDETALSNDATMQRHWALR